MSYRFQSDESVRDEFVRCAAEQLDDAVTQLSERIGDDPEDAVHSARKAVKKERSLLRLARGSLPAKRRRRENRALRNAARGLSAARDAGAMIDTLDQLSQRYAGQLPENAFGGVRDQLVQAREEQRKALVGSALGDRAVGELGAVRLRVSEWELKTDGWSALQDGLRRSYKDGRSAYRRARKHRGAEEWHAWRKRVKDLWYHERLLAGVGGPVVKGQAKDAHLLADLLGDVHDLDVLGESLAAGRFHAPVDLDALISLIVHRRDELQTNALWVAARIYAEKPKAFTRRMRRSWDAGRGRAAAARAQHPKDLADAIRAPHPA
ncbi:MAG TPA: CHAD domain-containing protein [Solirubrobacteraceae bacterium]|nr:CHAD domain-containing protein [Solirubrobacteraceae bacterium]